MDIKDVLTAIAGMDREQLSKVTTVVNLQWKRLTLEAAMKFTPGQLVKFTSSKDGRTVRGRVTSVTPRNVKLVEEGRGTKWTVSPGLLTDIMEPQA